MTATANGATIDRRSFLNPCPPTEDRITQVNRRRAAMVPPAPLVTPLAADPKFTEQAVLARHLIRHADSELLTSLSHVFGGTLRGKTLIEAAGNSGTKLIKLLLDEATKATGRDRSVVSAKHQLIISRGVKGEVNSPSLDKFLNSLLHELSSLLEDATAR